MLKELVVRYAKPKSDPSSRVQKPIPAALKAGSSKKLSEVCTPTINVIRNCLKGTVRDPPFIGWHVLYITVSFLPLSGQGCKTYPGLSCQNLLFLTVRSL